MKAITLKKKKLSKSQLCAILDLKRAFDYTADKTFWASEKRKGSTNRPRWGRYGGGKPTI